MASRSSLSDTYQFFPDESQTNRALILGLTTVRIPVKWSGDSGDVGQHRSEATLGCSYISEVDHLSQESGQVECNHHHFVSWSPESREGAFR
jgi:hypothetical protein